MSNRSLGGAAAAVLGSVAFAVASTAGVLEFGPVDKALGDAPFAVAVAIGDRVVAAVQDTAPPVLGWFDTQDWRDDARQIDFDGDLAALRCVEAAGDTTDPILLVGGSGVIIVHVDDSTAPATITWESPLGVGDGTIASIAWDAGRGVAYGADDGANSVHWIPVTGASGTIDSETGWPLGLGTLVPADLVVVDADTLLVIGSTDGATRAALIALDSSPPTWEELALPALTGVPIAVTSDPDTARAWIVTTTGDVVAVQGESVGDDDDSAGDDDDSAGDDDDSAGDDDDSAGDDDDSAGDDDDSAGDDDDSAGDDDDSAIAARADTWTADLLTDQGPAAATSIGWRDGVVWVVGGSSVASFDATTGVAGPTFSLSGTGGAIALSSSLDGFGYVTIEALGQIAVLSAGPFVQITEVSTSALSSSADSVDVTFVAGAPATEGTCAWNLVLDGTIAGDGALLSLDGEATLGEATTITIEGADLEAGNHRVHVFCQDDDGNLGRASFAYYMGELVAPSDFTLVAGNARVGASWTDIDDESVDHYVVYFSDQGTFAAGISPDTCTTDGTICSGDTVPVAATRGDTVSLDVTPLTNDTTYWFAVAAVDTDGSEGPRTEVLTSTPGVTGGVAAITGDPGCTCDYPGGDGGPRGLALLLVLALPLLARARRPRSLR